MNAISNIIGACFSFLDTYEGNATLLVLIVLLFKLYINHTATAIDYKKMFVSIPAEITFLVLGFLLSNLISSQPNDGENWLTGILVSLVVLTLQIAAEKYIDDKMSGKLGFRRILLIVVMYIASVLLYGYALFGGGING